MKNTEKIIPEVIELNETMLDQVNGGCVQAIATVFDFAVGTVLTTPIGLVCTYFYKRHKAWEKQKAGMDPAA